MGLCQLICPRSVKGTGIQDLRPTNTRTWKCGMGSLLREGHPKAGESSERGSTILRWQLQSICTRDRNAAGT